MPPTIVVPPIATAAQSAPLSIAYAATPNAQTAYSPARNCPIWESRTANLICFCSHSRRCAASVSNCVKIRSAPLGQTHQTREERREAAEGRSIVSRSQFDDSLRSASAEVEIFGFADGTYSGFGFSGTRSRTFSIASAMSLPIRIQSLRNDSATLIACGKRARGGARPTLLICASPCTNPSAMCGSVRHPHLSSDTAASLVFFGQCECYLRSSLPQK